MNSRPLITAVLTLLISFQSVDVTAAGDATAEPAEREVLTSIQLWSVGEALKEDFSGTLETIADMGFDGVEFAGYFGPYKKDPHGLKEFLASLGLQASGAHANFRPFRARFFETVAFYKALGVDTVIIPMDKRSFDPDQIEEFTAELNELADRLARFGLKTGYHNHWQEFEPYRDATFWDYVAGATDENVVLQLDVGWVNYSQKDAEAYVRKYPGRTFTTHLKPMFAESEKEVAKERGYYAVIGKDGFNWAPVLDAQLAVGGTKWFVLEQEEYPNGLSPLEAVRESKKGLDDFFRKIQHQ